MNLTVVTTGILAVVGVGSFCTFKLLQCIRQGRPPSLQNVKRFVVEASRPFILHWRKSPSQCGTTSQDITPIRHSTISNGQLSKRPSELPLTNWSPRGNRQFHTSRETSLERRLLTKDRTPLADCDIASGEEDINDIQVIWVHNFLCMASTHFAIQIFNNSFCQFPFRGNILARQWSLLLCVWNCLDPVRRTHQSMP